MKCYAAWNPDAKDRERCASGGVATLLSRYVLRQGGVVFGTRWNGNLDAEVSWTEDDLEPFKGSKYVQSSFPAQAREQMRAFLDQGRKVLFIGTPCQVAGLKSLRHYPGLVCADLICHGTVPPDYLRQEIRHLYKGRITDIRFRGNAGNDYHLTLWDGDRCVLDQASDKSPYFWGFLSGLTLREACFKCPFASLDRQGDVTLGDFIGMKEKASFVMTNTQAGEELLKGCGALLEERPLEERLAYGQGLLEPARPHPRRDRFLHHLQMHGFPKAVRMTLWSFFFSRPFVKGWRRIHHMAHLLKQRIMPKN